MRKAAALAWDGSMDSSEAEESSKVEARSKISKQSRTGRRLDKVKYNRRTIEIHPDIEALLDEMQIELRLRTHTEVMQKAIQLLAVVMGAGGCGRKKIFIEKEEGKLQEIIII
jgi:hypothetical protein